LDGTRTYLVGTETVAMIDPGPDVEDHVRALVMAVGDAVEVKIVLTHGHPDHAAAAGSVVDALRPARAVSIWGPAGLRGLDHVLEDGDAVTTDAGDLVAVHTPGHTREHLCFHWVQSGAVFAGDLLLGEGDTTWVAEYPGCVSDYLASLARLSTLGSKVIYPTHGPPLASPSAAIDRFEHHRRQRIAQVEGALSDHPGADAEHLLQVVYGDTLPRGMHAPALQSLGALLEYVRGADSR
jgi:glyoxylase-like metal-dependent hydrolase (beta-lactamase superfamily II)